MQFNNAYKAHKILLAIVLITITSPACFAEYFSLNASYKVCFTPGNNCAAEVIKTISTAKKQILVQAYSFTDNDIATALVKARRRGVDVRVILDKSQISSKYSKIMILERNRIKVLIDNKPAIAHNKIIIVDEHTVIGGSYNYSESAAKRNAENLLIINDTNFAQQYVKNWYIRERESVAVDKYHKKSKQTLPTIVVRLLNEGYKNAKNNSDKT
jgi:phospholipase D